MQLKSFTLCLVVLGMYLTSAKAQKPDRPRLFRTETESHPELPFRPMVFPQQNPHPDPGVFNEQPVRYNGRVREEILTDTSSIMPEANIVKGDPGVFGRVTDLQEGLSSRGFTAMALAPEPTAYPASTAVRLTLYFPNYQSQCSGVLIDAKHVLTAGHCVFDEEDLEWADSLGVAPAYDNGPNDFFGTSISYNMLSWTGWTQNGLYEHDMAVLELERPVGALAGWCGYGYNTSNAYFTGQTFHNYSYPGEPPYNGHRMYYRHGNFDSAQPNILYHNNYSWGGQSGSGAPDEEQTAYSTLSHGNSTSTGHTRIVSDKFMHIQEFIGENTPDETDFFAMKAGASHDYIAAGEFLDYVFFFLYNNSAQGFTGNILVNYYLSEDDYVGTSDDILIGTMSFWLDDLEAKGAEWIQNDYLMQIPPGTDPGSYYIGAHVTNSDFYGLNNYTDYQDAFPITVLCGTPEVPLLNVAGSLIKCEDAVVSLAPSNICDDCEVWWSNGEIGPSLSVTEAGAYYAYFLNSCGNFSDISDLILIENIPDPEVPEIEIDGSTLLCDGDFLTLTVTNPCPDCWVEWSDGQSGESIVVTEEGVYSACQENICSSSPDSDPVFVETAETPSAPGINANGSTSLCSGESVTLVATNICSGCIVEWSTGQTGNSISVSAVGNYSAILINDCGESGSSNIIAITQGSAPTTPTISASSSTNLCDGESVTLVATNICNGCTVEWSNGSTGTSITVSSGGTYSAIVSNSCGDSPASNIIVVTAEPAFLPVVQLNITCHLAAPNGNNFQWRLNGADIAGATGQFWIALEDGYYSVSMLNPAGCEGVSDPVFAEACVTSIADLLPSSHVRIYPNPASDRVHLEWHSDYSLSDVRFELITTDGRPIPVWRQEIITGGSTIEIPLPSIVSGLYVYRITSREGQSLGRLVIE